MTRVCVLGESGPVSEGIQAALASRYPSLQVNVLSSRVALDSGDLAELEEVQRADLVVLCVQDFASPLLVPKLPGSSRVLDISPAFRTDSQWVYGLPELPDQASRIASAKYVANPGCFATSAILALAPLAHEGLLSTQAFLYLDGVGGYTTGGKKMVDQAEAGDFFGEAVFSLHKEHRHVAEIRQVVGFTGPLFFAPKIVAVPKGIRMQVPLPGLTREQVLAVLAKAYEGSAIKVFDEQPKTLRADLWAGRAGAGLYVTEVAGGCSVVCLLDNLGKGAIDSALDNICLMLNL